MKDIFEILKAHGIEVEEAKQKDIRRAISENFKTINEFNDKVNDLTSQLNTANGTITDLRGKLDDASKVDVKALQDRIKEFEDAEATRKQNEAKQKELDALKNRFAPLKGENTFINEATENWMFEEFKKAIELDENKGKSDATVYETVIKDKNIYQSPNKTVIPPAGGSGGRDESQRTATLMKAMGLKSKGD